MRRDDVIAHLRQTEPALRALGVAGLYLFGSYARDDASAGSDVDVFVDVVPVIRSHLPRPTDGSACPIAGDHSRLGRGQAARVIGSPCCSPASS